MKQGLYHTIQRYTTLMTHRISALPIVILMPHSACNCRCVMCDIWKDNKNLKQLSEQDISGLLGSLKKLGTHQVLMSGGEAMLNHNFFSLCRMLRDQGIHITVLSTGLTLKKNASLLIEGVDDIIISLDGDEQTHDAIRNIPGAYGLLKQGIHYIKSTSPDFRITGRSVIHRLNFRKWHEIIASAKEIGLDQISFLPADVSSQAFNREEPWSPARQSEIALERNELPEMENIIDEMIEWHAEDFESGFIAESPEKIRRIQTYYSAIHGLNDYPFKKCNAPWVSSVIEADGSVRPCFFHDAIGNIRQNNLDEILNGKTGMKFRKELDMTTNETCRKCVCYLNLPPRANPAAIG